MAGHGVRAVGVTTFAVLLLAAALSDLARRRVPNSVVVAVAATGLLAQGFLGGAAGFACSFVAGVIVYWLLLGAWVKGVLGGGDLKLAVASATWLGPGRLPVFFLASALAGGAVAAVVYARSSGAARREIRRRLASGAQVGAPSTDRDERPARRTVPYAMAISAGAMVAILWGGVAP
jgi:prepilin peptidase CpaA